MNLKTALELAAHRYPEIPAIITREDCFTFERWNRRVNALAHSLLEAGIKPGERIGICTQNGEPAATAYFAAHKLRGAAVFINARSKHHDIMNISEEAKLKALLFDERTESEVRKALESLGKVLPISTRKEPGENTLSFADLVKDERDTPPAVPISDREIGTILYTSGTAGRPKGVARTPESDYYGAFALILEQHWERFERILGVMPLYHTMGLHTLISIVLLNGTYILLPKFDPAECLTYIEQGQVSALYLVPTAFYDLVSHIKTIGRNRIRVPKLAFAGAPMSGQLIRQCQETFAPDVFVNQYGSTEMVAITINPDLKKKPASAGRPALHSRIRIVAADRERTVSPEEEVAQGEVGEVIVAASSPQTFSGYLKRPEATAKVLRNGWYFTGDLGYLDEDGDLYLKGRIDDMIISGGENIYPEEVEQVLLLHPQVKDAAVVGLPDKRWGEVVTAFIAPTSPVLTAEELDRFCLERPDLARYKRPRKFALVAEIPRSPGGKVLRALLRDTLSGVQL